MYEIINSGGRQLKVAPGSLVTVDRLSDDPGQEVNFDRVLLVEKDGGEIVVGTPYVSNASVLGIVDAETQGPKIRVFKKKRRKGFRRTQGHRSILTRIRVKDIIVK